nr:hypothetical protein [Mycobacterium riyadhense]
MGVSPSIDVSNLSPVERTALLTRYARALDSRWPRVAESCNPRLTLVEEASLAHAPEVELFPGWIRLATKVFAKFKAGARKARILRYRFATV